MAVAKKVETVAIRMPSIKHVKIRIVGDSPLIVHAWSEKAKREMLEAQQDKEFANVISAIEELERSVTT